MYLQRQVVKNGKCYIFIPSSNPYLQLEVNHLVFAQKSLQYLTFPSQLLTLLKTHLLFKHNTWNQVVILFIYRVYLDYLYIRAIMLIT